MKKPLLKRYQPLALAIAFISTPVTSFAASQESIDLAQQMYVAYYGRPGDPGGWAWWADKFDESPSVEDALEAFGNSQEYYNSFGELSSEQLITNLYQQLFNRDPDPGGLAFYAGWLSEGKSTLASIAKQVADGAQNSDAIVLANKIQTANYFTQQIDTLQATYYSDDIPSAQYFLRQVNETSESLTSTQEDINSWIPTRDLDEDGIIDAQDEFLTDPNNGEVDSDNDGVTDNIDAFPNDPNEIADSDSDGTGDNADAFPNDANEISDSDGDGTGDNTDAFPNNAWEVTDSDGDGTGDNTDAFPNDASEIADSDRDGTGNNSDAFPNDANEIADSDGDGVGNNSDAYPNDTTQVAEGVSCGTTNSEQEAIFLNKWWNITPVNADNSDPIVEFDINFVSKCVVDVYFEVGETKYAKKYLWHINEDILTIKYPSDTEFLSFNIDINGDNALTSDFNDSGDYYLLTASEDKIATVKPDTIYFTQSTPILNEQDLNNDRVDLPTINFDLFGEIMSRSDGWCYSSYSGKWHRRDSYIECTDSYNSKSNRENFNWYQFRGFDYGGTLYTSIVYENEEIGFDYPSIYQGAYDYKKTTSFNMTNKEYEKLHKYLTLRNSEAPIYVVGEKASMTDNLRFLGGRYAYNDEALEKSVTSIINFTPSIISTWGDYAFLIRVMKNNDETVVRFRNPELTHKIINKESLISNINNKYFERSFSSFYKIILHR